MIRVNFILKSKFLGSKAMGKAMNPHFPLATFRVQPHARLRQPRLCPEFVWSVSDTAAAIFQRVADQVGIEVYRELWDGAAERVRDRRTDFANHIPDEVDK